MTSASEVTNNALLNRDSKDGCWDIVFMICGGTGIAPMIQLVIIV